MPTVFAWCCTSEAFYFVASMIEYITYSIVNNTTKIKRVRIGLDICSALIVIWGISAVGFRLVRGGGKHVDVFSARDVEVVNVKKIIQRMLWFRITYFAFMLLVFLVYHLYIMSHYVFDRNQIARKY